MGVRLPAEYQETEYIQSTGTQYFTTDIPKYNDIVFDCVQEITANRDQYLIGWAYQNQWNQVQACGWYNNKGQCAYGGSYTAGSIALNTKVHTRYEFAPGTQKVYIDGNLVSTQTKTNGSADNGLPFLMFCGRLPNTNPTPYYYSAQKVYSLKVYHADQIIADYVPCYRKSDGEIGMFDLVLQKFYTNEGTGVFLKGADVIDSISPWLVARRRMLMRKPLVDTSPKISTYGKRLYGVSGTANSASCCITEFYDVETIPTVQGRIVLGTPATGAQSNFQCWNDNGAINYAEKAYPYLYVGTTRIRFTLLIDNIDDSYAYNPDDGQIWFAGKNTIYYGYTNINDMPTGT